MMKLYKEYVILGVAVLGILCFGGYYIIQSMDQSPTVDLKTPAPLETQH